MAFIIVIIMVLLVIYNLLLLFLQQVGKLRQEVNLVENMTGKYWILTVFDRIKQYFNGI
jgi:hypothetical protein